MAISAEQLNVILSAKDKEFTRAMDRSQRRVERFSKQSSKSLTKTSKSFSNLALVAKQVAGPAALGAAGAAMMRTLRNATEMAFEIDNLSRIAGTSAERFQELAHASASVGIEQSKLSDILKDVNDKFGDYYATGAGPLADFFDNIAPKVGLAKDAFQGLSSDQALGLYVKSLQDANVSQAELTFYMEALASDSTALTPLLQNNAAALNQISEAGRELGLVMDEDIVKKGANMQRQWLGFVRSMRTSFNTLAIDVITGFDQFFNISDDADFADMNARIDAAADRRAKANQKIQSIMNGSSYTDLNLLDKGLVNFQQKNAQAASDEINMLDFALTALQKKMSQRNSVLEQLNAPLDLGLGGGTGSGTGSTVDTVSDMEKAIKAYDSLSSSLDPVIAATNKYADAEKTVNTALKNRSISSEQAAATLSLARVQMEQSISAASDLASVFETIDSSMEEAFMGIIDGTMSAKDAFKSMATDIIKELYRVLVVQKIVGAISGAITGSFGGGATPNPHTRASGGPVKAGQPYVTGEHGRELFVPKVDGRILSGAQTSNAARSGGDNVTVNQTINVSTGVQQTVRTEIKTLMPQIAEAAKGAVVDAKRRGGSYGRSFA
jgi:hypothetical protein